MPGNEAYLNEAHLSDEDLLLFSDHELPLREAAIVRRHVARCEPCRGRLVEFEKASDCVGDLHEQEVRAQASHAFPRDLLKARLSEASAHARRSRSVIFGWGMTRQLASACLALILVVGGAWAIRHIAGQPSGSDASMAEVLALPRKTLTPGSTRAVRMADLCSNQNPDNDPPVSPLLEQAVFNEYGVPPASKENYELDYLITPALGGSGNIQNLWPQPYSSTWNAHVKDQLEDHLHELVCQGKLQLTTAQSDIASDWIAAYKRYFNTGKPEPSSFTAASIPPGHELDTGHGIRAQYRTSFVYNLALMDR
jgi:hypothetical protein